MRSCVGLDRIGEVARPDCDLEQGPQRRRRDKRIATPPEGLGVELVREAMRQSSLANPGLARHEEERTAAPQRVGVGLMESRERLGSLQQLRCARPGRNRHGRIVRGCPCRASRRA